MTVLDSELLFQRTRTRCQGRRDLPIDGDVRHTTAKGDITLRTTVAEVGDLGWLHGFVAAGPKVSIISTFLYPRHDRVAPSYAMEFVVLGRRPVVAVLDLPSLCGERAARSGEHAIAQACKQFPGHRPGSDPPDWFVDCRSGYDLFERPMTTCLPRLVDTHLHLVDVWQELVRSAPREPCGSEAHATRQQQYRQHHRDHTPGLRFLHRAKGEAWTARLLDTVFGPPPAKKADNRPHDIAAVHHVPAANSVQPDKRQGV